MRRASLEVLLFLCLVLKVCLRCYFPSLEVKTALQQMGKVGVQSKCSKKKRLELPGVSKEL